LQFGFLAVVGYTVARFLEVHIQFSECYFHIDYFEAGRGKEKILKRANLKTFHVNTSKESDFLYVSGKKYTSSVNAAKLLGDQFANKYWKHTFLLW